jgi:hypothetical protein
MNNLPKTTSLSYDLVSSEAHLNDRIDDKHCHEEGRLLQARMNAASAKAAAAKVWFSRTADLLCGA